MAEHHDEMEQIEALKRWWLENRSFVIAGLVIGVAAVAGWRGWEWHRTRQAEQASALYAQLAESIGAKDQAKAETLASQLREGYRSTPYASNGALLFAKAALEAGDTAKARTYLDWVVVYGDDAELKLLARTRLARVHIADGRADEALKLLADVATGAFDGMVQDVRGDAHAALGHTEEARKAWQAALEASDGNLADRQMIDLKLAALGPAATADQPAKAPAAVPATGATP